MVAIVSDMWSQCTLVNLLIWYNRILFSTSGRFIKFVREAVAGKGLSVVSLGSLGWEAKYESTLLAGVVPRRKGKIALSGLRLLFFGTC